MGRLIKNHWARLIVLVAAAYQVAAAVEAFFWPKLFWDFLTVNLNGALTPVPALQMTNLLLGIGLVSLEWPLPAIAGLALHQSLHFRLLFLPLAALAAALMYQSTDAAVYYLIGIALYFWAYAEGEMICPQPWALPPRRSNSAAAA